MTQLHPAADYRRKVLIVEDEAINRLMLGNIVSRDYEVLYAQNGQEGLDIMKENASGLSLVLLDLLMPVLDGFSVLKIMHEDERLRQIPTVVLTSEGDAEVDSIRLGAMDFIKKPYNNPEVILARIQRIIELFEDRKLIRNVEYDQTGLLTREFFLEYMRQMDEREKADRDLIAVRIENFSLVNEIYGREEGDHILATLADSLRHFLTVHPGIAGHEDAGRFYLYCTHLEDPNELQMIAEELKKLEEIPRVRLRFGIYPVTEQEDADLENRLNSAVFACDSLQESASENIALYDHKVHEEQVLAERLISDMDRALEEKEFLVFLQPKFNVENDKPLIAGAEALVRWKHHDLGMVSPGTFIPLFEKNGLVHPLDLYMLEECARIVSGWWKEYGTKIPVSINLSRIDFYDADLKKKLDDVLAKYGLEKPDIHLEVTESAYTDDNLIVERIREMQEAGYVIEMDDFGAGFSSLNMLSSMPIDYLKLDLKFARTVDTDEKQYHVVECIADFSRYLNVSIIAEGVENREQYEALKKAGCAYVQGYYLDRPLNEEDFLKYIRKEEEEC